MDKKKPKAVPLNINSTEDMQLVVNAYTEYIREAAYAYAITIGLLEQNCKNRQGARKMIDNMITHIRQLEAERMDKVKSLRGANAENKKV